MIHMVSVELKKLNGSLALALAMLAPALPGFLTFLSLLTAQSSPRWSSVFEEFVLPIWALFLLPMVIAAFTTLVGQIEYRTRGWDHILALPIPRWQIFTAKAIVVLGVNMAMTVLILVYAWGGASIGGAISGYRPIGPIPWMALSEHVGWLMASSTMLVIIQTWVALRFASFVVPLSVGIAGTLVTLAVAMTQAKEANWFPWVLPQLAMLSPDPLPVAILGGGGGAVLMVLMVFDLSRKQFR
jgi:lantibiotic transport system permease protein